MVGMSGMRYRTFLVWNATGGLIWAPGCVLLGYAFSTSLDTVGQSLTWAPFVILAVVAAGYLALHMRKRRREKAEAAAFAEANAEPGS
jgi:membrane-associated protein